MPFIVSTFSNFLHFNAKTFVLSPYDHNYCYIFDRINLLIINADIKYSVKHITPDRYPFLLRQSLYFYFYCYCFVLFGDFTPLLKAFIKCISLCQKLNTNRRFIWIIGSIQSLHQQQQQQQQENKNNLNNNLIWKEKILQKKKNPRVFKHISCKVLQKFCSLLCLSLKLNCLFVSFVLYVFLCFFSFSLLIHVVIVVFIQFLYKLTWCNRKKVRVFSLALP